MTGGTPLLLRQPPQAEHGGLCLLAELIRASWGKHTHTHLTGGHPRELICQGSCLRVCVCQGI